MLCGDIELNPGPVSETAPNTSANSSAVVDTKPTGQASVSVTLPLTQSDTFISADSHLLYQKLCSIETSIANLKTEMSDRIQALDSQRKSDLICTNHSIQQCKAHCDLSKEELQKELVDVRAENSELKKRVHLLEKEDCAKSFIVFGIAEAPGEDAVMLKSKIISAIPQLSEIQFYPDRIGQKARPISGNNSKKRPAKIQLSSKFDIPCVYKIMNNLPNNTRDSQIQLKKFLPPHTREMQSALWNKIAELRSTHNDPLQGVRPIGNEFKCQYGKFVYKSAINQVIQEAATNQRVTVHDDQEMPPLEAIPPLLSGESAIYSSQPRTVMANSNTTTADPEKPKENNNKRPPSGYNTRKHK